MSDLSAMSPSQRLTSYALPYPIMASPWSHPNRLGAMARLLGVEPEAPTQARVLELGCGDGSNLLPMAEQNRSATFIGIDASEVQIGAGTRAIEAAGLKNVQLRTQSILDFPATEGKFDYIIANGVFSWVPEPVREKILAICKDHLADRGIAYITYNALPGWNMRRSLRDMLMYHTRMFPDANTKVAQARALLRFMSDSVPPEQTAFGAMLKGELESLSQQEDGLFRHDMLQEENTPVYFHEFVSRAQRHGLQYLSEPSLALMLASNFPENIRKTLSQVGNNIVAQEQYMDFLKNQAFRRTLLCRAGLPIARGVGVDRMKELCFRSTLSARIEPVDLSPGIPISFSTISGQNLTATDSFLKALFQVFAQNVSSALTYKTLLQSALAIVRVARGAGVEIGDANALLATNLRTLAAQGFVELFLEPVMSSSVPPEKPKLTPLMRFQALNARRITNRLHEGIHADNLARNVMDLCDGTRSAENILAALVQRAGAGILSISELSQEIKDEARLREILRPRIDSVLMRLAHAGFFPA